MKIFVILLLSLPALAQHTATATISPSPTQNVTSYNLYRGLAGVGPFVKIAALPTNSLSFTDATVEAGQSYWYVATAVNPSGESVYSPQARADIPATPPPPPPPSVQFPINMTCDTLVAGKGGRGVPNFSVSQVVLTNCVPTK